jgi:hypothetical protein
MFTTILRNTLCTRVTFNPDQTSFTSSLFIHHYIVIQWKGGGGKERTFRFKGWDRSECFQGSAKLQNW